MSEPELVKSELSESGTRKILFHREAAKQYIEYQSYEFIYLAIKKNKKISLQIGN